MSIQTLGSEATVERFDEGICRLVYLRRAAVSGITWPVPEGVDDAELERRLFTLPTFDEKPARPLPDWSHVNKELKRRAVTLLLLWEEHRSEHADGYGYSGFCDLYGEWRQTISPTMRQTHGAAEKLFVDSRATRVPAFDAVSGADRRAHRPHPLDVAAQACGRWRRDAISWQSFTAAPTMASRK